MALKVSVIVPFYKTPKLKMRKCLDSLLEQSFQDFEVLVIDDGNESGYEDIQKEYEERDNRISFVNKEHEGVSAARNEGLRLAKGEFVAFVDSDDYLEIDYLEKLYAAIQDADIAICAIEEQWFPTPNRWENRQLFFSQPAGYLYLQYVNFCHNKLFKLKIILDYDLKFPLGVKLGEDALFVVAYLEKVQSVRCISDRLYHYVPDGGSAVTRYREEFWIWEQKVVEAQWNLFHQYSLSKGQEPYAYRWLYLKIKYALHYYLQHCPKEEICNNILEEIIKHPLFAQLMEYDFSNEKMLFNRNDRIVLGMWRVFGTKGIKIAWKIHKCVRRIKR